MSRNLSNRNNHFTEPVLPGPVVAFRAQRAGVEFNEQQSVGWAGELIPPPHTLL